jgi:streptogramin lyase
MSAAEVAVNAQGQVFVADHHGSRMLKYDSAGQLLASWSAATPVGVSLNAQGNVWVAEPYSNRLRLFTPDGQEVAQISSSALAGPYGLEVAPDGTLLVANYSAPNVVRLSPTGALLATYSTSGTGNHGVFASSNGDFLVANAFTPLVEAFNAGGTALYSLTSPGVGDAFGNDSVTDVAVSPQGMIYVVDRRRSRVCVFADSRPTPTQTSSWGALKARFR